MLALEIRFLAGRFHGNPWYSAHNEGIPEWPPSPWRLLRALVSAAYDVGLAPADVEPLLTKLLVLPRYRIPAAVDAHTRHYMPEVDDANHKRAKVFDSFVAVDGGAHDPRPLTVAWPLDLPPQERALLERLCARITYLGRAESWADVRVTDVDDLDWDCWPDDTAAPGPATNLLAVQEADMLASWASQRPKPNKGPDIPRRVWDVLTIDGQRYRSEGWSRVPGTRLVRYLFRRPPFLRAVVPTGRHRAVRHSATVARFAIRSAVLPRVQDAIAVCERLRKSALKQSGSVAGIARAVFSGHGDEPSNHRHAMYLACTEDPANEARGLIDHLIIATRGTVFEDVDIEALQRLTRLWSRSGHALELVLAGLGTAADFGGIAAPRSRVLATHRVWESVTPFIPVRHPKLVRGEWRDAVGEQVRRACKQLLGVEPERVEEIGARAEWTRFRRQRRDGGGRRGPDLAYGVRLVFADAQEGPIALGYGAHFGLGLFHAVAHHSIP